MKIRNGFISNSSSSSFIVAIDISKNRPCKCCGRTDPNFIDAVNRSSASFDDNDVNADGYKNVVHYINEMEYSEQEWKDKITTKLKPYKNEKKWKVVDIRLSYHDETLSIMLENMISAKTAVLVYDAEGRIRHED